MQNFSNWYRIVLRVGGLSLERSWTNKSERSKTVFSIQVNVWAHVKYILFLNQNKGLVLKQKFTQTEKIYLL